LSAHDAFELELRRLAGVVGVGFYTRDHALEVHLLVVAPGEAIELRREATQIAQALVDQPVVINIHDAAAAWPQTVDRAERPPRVQLLAVRRPDGEDGEDEVEVHLAHRGARTVGRGRGGHPSGAVSATMEALAGLGAHLPFHLRSAGPVGIGENQAVIVVLDPLPEGRSRMGVASSGTVEESACRATLHALNRFLCTDTAFSAAEPSRALTGS